jgi:hypothetical protein
MKYVHNHRQQLRCPICSNKEGYIEGEYIGNGVGMQQVSPDGCSICGWIQVNMFTTTDGFTDEQLQKLWELQVAPY